MLSSVRDIQILRGNSSGKTTLMIRNFRFAAILVSKEFHLLFFPYRIQRLRGIIARFVRDDRSHFFAVDSRIRQFHQQIKQHRIATFTLLQACSSTKLLPENVL